MTAAFAAGMLLVSVGLSLGTFAIVESVVDGGVDA